jgi:hypothetical protein
VLGTETNPVYFTSYRDDTIGGDTNGDGASNGARGDWYDIRFTDTSDDTHSIIDHAIIRYGGDSYLYNHSGAISLISASPQIQNTSIIEAQWCAIYANMFSFPDLNNNTLQDNERNGFCPSGGTLDIDATWNITDTSYFLLDDVTVFIGNTLTVNPDVIVKFANHKRLTVDGALRVLGTETNPVYFTSYRDDTIGGDTNGDGASNGIQGDWYDIRFTNTSDDAKSIIDHTVIRYGGDSFSTNRSGGISLIDASPRIQNSALFENQYAGIYASDSQPELVCMSIFNNYDHGIMNATPVTLISAENLWWGSISGPYHPTSNPTGSGNIVSDGVDFIPWLKAPCGLPEPEELSIYLPIVLR